ncbi:MAG: nucleotidyltransferase family protein [Halanaerobiaceae bacterium]
MKFDVLILGAGLNNGGLKDVSGVEYECMIDIDGRPMVEYVVEAAANAKGCHRVALVGPAIDSPELDFVINDNSSFFSNLQKGVKILGKNDYVLFISADIPLLTGKMIDDYLDLCTPGTADFFYPVIPREIIQKKIPASRRTYIKLKEGSFTGGNLMLMNPGVVIDPSEWLRMMVAGRKSPWKMIRLLGVKIIIKYLLGSLSIGDVEARVEDILGYSGVAVETQIPEIGFDVDKPLDLKLVRELFLETYT